MHTSNVQCGLAHIISVGRDDLMVGHRNVDHIAPPDRLPRICVYVMAKHKKFHVEIVGVTVPHRLVVDFDACLQLAITALSTMLRFVFAVR